MAHKTEVWGNERKARTISIFKHDGVFDICRSYSQSDGYTVEKMVTTFQLRQAALVLGGGGKEMWSHGLNQGQTETLVAQFRKSAEKAGFTDFGIAQM